MAIRHQVWLFHSRRARQLIALVRAGATFRKGKLRERPVDITPPEPTESTRTLVA